MKSKFYIQSVLTMPLLLVAMFFLAGCQTSPTTLTVETENRMVEGTCEAWRPITYSSRDTEETTLQVRANNAAWTAYCSDRK